MSLSLFSGALYQYDEEDLVDLELRGIMAYSASGKLFVVGDDGTIKAADVRQQLLSGEWSPQGGKPAAGAAAPPTSVRTITAHPPLELTASHFALNRSGTYAAVAGSALEDPEISRIVVVDLTNCRPAPASAVKPAVNAPPAAPTSPAGGAPGRRDVCEAVALDPELFASRPGLRVLQVAWHPDSDSHLAVLTSDNTWRLYNTQRADMAEQTFELQLRGRRGLGLGMPSEGGGSGASRAVTAFAFGPPEGWSRFAVYFLTADGSLWSLCPVVPFGCRFPGSAIDQLADSAGAPAALEASPNDEAWLQRAFLELSTPQDAGLSAGMMQSVPHALDEHVPALAGPLPVATAAGQQEQRLTQVAGGPDAAQALLLSRYAEGCSALSVGTARGFVGLHLLAGGAGPAWFEAAPQCICEGAEIESVRSQVGAVPAASSQAEVLLLDVVNLSFPPDAASSAGADDPEDGFLEAAGGAPPASIALLQDAAAPELLYAVHSSGAHAVSLPWLPLLAGLAAGEDGGGQLPAALPQPGAELLLRSSKGVVAAAPVGDALSGSALVVLEADGRPQCLRPHSAALAGGSAAAGAQAGAAAGAAQAGAAAQQDIEAQLATIYGDLRKGPKPCALPQAAPGRPAVAGDPEGQRLLNEAAAALRASHVEFAHQAHQDLVERIQQLKGELDKQRQRAEAAEQAAGAAEQAAAALDAQAQRVARFQENLGERLRLLAELHWSLPRPPSLAEQRFASEQLPAFEAAAASLEEDTRALRARVSSLHRKLRSVGEAAAAAALAAGGGAAAAVAPHQLRRVREALAEQEGQIGANQQRLAVLEEAVAAAAAAS